MHFWGSSCSSSASSMQPKFRSFRHSWLGLANSRRLQSASQSTAQQLQERAASRPASSSLLQQCVACKRSSMAVRTLLQPASQSSSCRSRMLLLQSASQSSSCRRKLLLLHSASHSRSCRRRPLLQQQASSSTGAAGQACCCKRQQREAAAGEGCCCCSQPTAGCSSSPMGAGAAGQACC